MPAPPLTRLAPFILPAVGALVLLGAVRALPHDGPSLGRLLLLLAAAAIASLYRPAGIGLGAGTAALPLGRALLGWGSATVLATAASAIAGLVPPAPGERRSSRSRTRRAVEDAAVHAVAGAAAAGAWSLLEQPFARGALAAVTWVAVLAAVPLAQRRLTSLALPDGWWRPLGGLAVDLGGWVVGLMLLQVWRRAGWELAVALLVATAALAAEAARQRHLRRRAESGRAAFEQLGRAGERLVASPSATADVAMRVLQECRQVLPLSWFHLEVTAPATTGGSWHAGPDGRMREGWPRVPSHPPPLPGLHRRADWHLLERRLLSGGIELARLTLWCDPRRLRGSGGNDPTPLFEQLLPQLAGLVHRAVLDTQAHQDPLTGVALRRVLDVRLRAALETSRETGNPIAVALLDLDFFKRINDRYGHASGDRALVAVAEVLRRHVRDNDLCARYGGEEFTLLFDGLGGDAALAIVERLRGQVEELRVEHDGERLPLSVSAGIAAYPEVPSRTAEELLQVADSALYEAKRLGRNCCLLHTGRGRYVDGKGRVVETGEAATPQVPQIFA